jgi:hypothetical protein
MKTVEAGMQGQVPQLAVTPIDRTLPICGVVFEDVHGVVKVCTYGKGHGCRHGIHGEEPSCRS